MDGMGDRSRPSRRRSCIESRSLRPIRRWAMPTYCAIIKKTNRSGVSGLSRVDRLERSNGRLRRRLYWEVQWPIEGCRAKHRKFSILKYGEEAAFEMAFAARQRGLEAVAAHTFSPFATRSKMRTRAA